MNLFNGQLAVAIEGKVKARAGWFYNGEYVGYLPDMLTFTQNGKWLAIQTTALTRSVTSPFLISYSKTIS